MKKMSENRHFNDSAKSEKDQLIPFCTVIAEVVSV